MDEAAQTSINLNWVDIGVVVIMLLSAILAFLRGFLREAVSLGTWVGASGGAIYFYPYVQPWMRERIQTAAIADAVTGLATFCVALIILIPIGTMIASMVKGKTLTAIDRSLGFVFGLLRGILVVCLLYMIVMWAWPQPDQQPAMFRLAKTRPILATGAEWFQSMIPAASQKEAKDAIERAEETKKNLDKADDFLQQLTIPKPGVDKNKQQPAYNNQQRENLEQLINRQGNE